MSDKAEKAKTAEVARVTWVALATNLSLAALKFAAGIIGRSQAVTADAVRPDAAV